jgi:hypothetical protein
MLCSGCCKNNPLYVLLVYALMVQSANFSWLFILFSSLCDSFFLIFDGKKRVFAYVTPTLNFSLADRL